MVTLPLLNYGIIHWCLLSGHLLIFLQLVLSSIFQCHAISGHESQAISEGHLELFFKESPKRIPFCYDEEYSLRYVKKTISCYDLKGVGSLNSTCTLNSDLQLDGDLCITGTGNLELSSHVSIRCPTKGCSIIVNITGILKVSEYATIVAGSVTFEAESITLEHYSSINTSSLGGPPPAQTSGTPSTLDGAGGGHGGRGASCLKKNKTNWGGDVYAWSTLSSPWSYGSKGGSTSSNEQYGGDGGGRVMLKANNTLSLDGYVTAEGGDGSLKGGGGSGGSIVIHALKLKGEGMISAAGGSGWGGGGGGRISLDCYSIQDVLVSAHGGKSFGCPANAGAAGTTFDRSLRSLKVSNDNFSTETETPLLDFPTMVLWSNVFVESGAKVLVPLLWTRVQVRGQIRLLSGGQISFGLSDLPVSEFEMVAEELLMSNSIIKVYGAFRMYVKMLLMWDSKIEIDGGKDKDVGTSLLEVRNLVVLRHNSVICSNGELGVFGQGLLTLSGHGDAIRAQRVFLSLFYSIAVGPGALLQAPLDSEKESTLATRSRCESQTCPLEIIEPPDDCHVNSTMSFTLHICRVEDLIINGSIRASVLRIHRARTVVINYMGMLSASELGCKDGMGKGTFLSHGAGGGAGHGGKGGAGFFNGTFIAGGAKYGDADLPCELGSGSGGSNDLLEHASGGGLIVIGSTKWPLSKLEIYGSLRADGETHGKSKRNYNGTLVGGLGGGSGGTLLLFLQALVIGNNSSLSIDGGDGGPIGGGGGGGGRVHFDWSNIAMGDEYVQLATLNGTIDASGGKGRDGGYNGEPGTITGKACPEGLFGTFCNECPLGTFKDVVGSDPSLCNQCSSNFVPNRATFIYVRGGATRSACPYKCLSDKYKLPKCQTPLEELVYTFGGPWLFSLLLSSILIILACLLSALRVKLLRSYSSYQDTDSMRCHGPTSSPHLLSLAEVQGTSRAEETQSHVHRMYFMGPNNFREPWHLPYSPPAAIIGIVYEDAFNRFIDEINSIAAYEWWEGSIHIILAILAYPCSWSWRQWRRKVKALRLQEYVKSEYDHACLRSCRSRALYKGMKVGSTPDLMVAYIDFFLGGDEKHLDVDSTIAQRFPLCIIFGGNGSYMSPYYLHNDTLLTNLISQHVPGMIWNRFVSDLNSQLRIVSQGSIRSGLHSIISWMHSDGNSQLMQNGVKIELGWFQATPSGYYQLGILVKMIHHFPHIRHRLDNADSSHAERSRKKSIPIRSVKHLPPNQPSVSSLNSSKRVTGGVSGGIINQETLQSLGYKRDFLFPFSLLLRNARPIGLQDTVQLIIAVMLLGDLVVTILMMFQLYWISLTTFLVALFILPLSFISPFPAGLYALLSRGPRRSSLARMYVLWNITSLSNIIAACTCGILSYGFPTYGLSLEDDTWNVYRDDNVWWILPTVLLIIKLFQVQFVNWHIANLEVHDYRALPGS